VALAANALITIDELRAMTEDVKLPTDTTLELLINQASQIAETKCKRKLATQSLDVVLDAPIGRKKLLLPEYPVVSVTSVYVDSERAWEAESLVTDYYVDTPSAILHRDVGWGTTAQSVRVVFEAGYETVPPDLQGAIVELILWLKRRQPGGNVGVRTLTDPDGTATEIEISMPLHVQRVLFDYARVA